MTAKLDHLVIVASDLAVGVRHVRETLGVDVPPGGVHARMGTHNHVMQLGGGVYLEVIAIDPGAGDPRRPRWFDMDNPLLHARLERGPALMTWVVNVTDFDALPGFDARIWGEPQRMTRGDLEWLVALPEDGRLPGAGMLPTVIQWLCDPPVSAMADRGCRIARLDVRHPQPDWYREQLAKIGAETIDNVPFSISRADAMGFEAALSTPLGERVLSSF